MCLTAETLMINRPLLPCEVAERWGCSERHVRNLIASGQLGHFRVGSRLLRIPAAAVEEYELQQAGAAKAAAALASQETPAAERKRGPNTALMRALARKRREL